MTESERNLPQQWFERVWNKGQREAIADLLNADAVIHDGGQDTRGTEGFYAFFERIHASLSQIDIQVLDTVAEGDKVCARWICTARHTGDGLGVPATNKTIHITGITIMRLSGGKLIEGWQNWDMLGLMQQIQGGERAATYIAMT